MNTLDDLTPQLIQLANDLSFGMDRLKDIPYPDLLQIRVPTPVITSETVKDMEEFKKDFADWLAPVKGAQIQDHTVIAGHLAWYHPHPGATEGCYRLTVYADRREKA